MRRLLCAAAVIAIAVPNVAAAQSRNDRNDKNQPSQTQTRSTHQRAQSQRTRTTHPAGTVQRTQSRTTRSTRVTRPATTVQRTTRVTRPATTVQRTTRVTTGQTARSLPTYRIGRRPTTFHRIRTTTFRYPSGYRYRRWSSGSILPRLFLSSLYFWNDWSALGLGPPPRGYVWVRYGPDLLLVNRYTGRIVDVIYGAFY